MTDDNRKPQKRAEVDAETARRELALALLYLNRMREKGPKGGPDAWFAWKNHDFETLDELAEAGWVEGKHRSKTLWFTEAGVAAAKEVLAKYGVADWPQFAEKPAGMGKDA